MVRRSVIHREKGFTDFDELSIRREEGIDDLSYVQCKKKLMYVSEL